MVKAVRETSKEASNPFHNIMAASVKGNPKPVAQPRKDKPKKSDEQGTKGQLSSCWNSNRDCRYIVNSLFYLATF